MYFKRLDIQGFKSFADPVSIEFHEGITCIVGPNGSGKSNISDAIRWVLGEQSAKLLRGGKMEEVIFAGTAHHKSRGMAEVTLVIDNTSGILPIDYTEVAITRRMYRSGESGYFINQVACRLKDIRELIMDTGIGVDGYSIIGQGRISDILSDKPEARREIFEEAAGIVKYRSKKEETERKLASSQDNLDRVEDIIGEIESRIDGLREDSIKASEYIELRDRFKEIEINITLRNIENLEGRNEKLKEDIEGADQAIVKHETDRQSLSEELGQKETRLREIESLSEEKRNRLLNLVDEINNLSSKGQLDNEKLVAYKRDKERLKLEVENFKDRQAREQENSNEILQGREGLSAEYKDQKAALDLKTKETEDLEERLANFQKDLEDQKDNIFESHRLLVEKKSEVKNILSLQDALNLRRDQLAKDKDGRKDSLAEIEESHKSLEEEKAQAEKSLTSIKEKLASLQKDYQEATDQVRDLIKDQDRKRLQSGQTEARLKVIEEMEEAYEGYNQAVKFIMKTGRTGIHGAVADLIQVPTGYEKAIETALGAGLQNIICENDSDAKSAVALLKEKQVGRLTFLPVNSIKSSVNQNIGGFKGEKGFKGSGVDCVTFDGKYRSVMEYLLGRVVIVESLDDGVRMSKSSRASGLRFVSLEGEVVNASGAITGGAYRTKTAGLLERKSEVVRLLEKVKDLAKDLAQGEARLEKAENFALDLIEQIKITEQAEKEGEITLLSKESQLAALTHELSSIEGQKDRENQELANIDQEMTSADKNTDALKEEIARLEELVASVEGRLLDSQEERQALEKELEKSRLDLTDRRLDLGKTENQLLAIDETLNRIKAYIEEYGQEIIVRQENLATIEEEEKAILEGDQDRGGLLIEKEEEREGLNQDLAKLGEERNQITTVLAEEREKKDSLDGDLDGLRRNKHEAELRLARHETQLEGHKERLWEDFEISYIQAVDFKKNDFVMSRAMKESREIRDRMRELGEVNIGAIQEYESVRERYDFLQEQKSDLTEAMDSLQTIIEDMDRSIRKSFTESFDQVVINFETTFKSLFGGGQAELRLADESKPLETGIDIIVQPPGKKLQNISLLSGGEKSLTAIALMFAILKTKPTPFCILDEVESALDETNIERFAKYLRAFKEIQFTLVTHQKATMEYADVLYGVTMPEGGISKLISLKLGDDWEV